MSRTVETCVESSPGNLDSSIFLCSTWREWDQSGGSKIYLGIHREKKIQIFFSEDNYPEKSVTCVKTFPGSADSVVTLKSRVRWGHMGGGCHISADVKRYWAKIIQNLLLKPHSDMTI